MVAVVPFDWQAHDTAFITAHLHYVLFGGFVFPIFAGLYYWLPHVTGRQRFFCLGEFAFALVFTGFHVTFFAMHWVGLLGQRRRIPTYAPEDGWTAINLISSVGSFVMAIGIGMILIDIILHALTARRGRRNPWNAGTLEWAMTTPPPAYNFASLPQVTSRDPLVQDPSLDVRLARGEGYLGQPRNGWRETLTVDIASGKPDMQIIYPENTRLPIHMAAVTGVFFLSMLLKCYWTIPVAVIGVICLVWRWVWGLGGHADLGAVPVGCGVTLPNAAMTDRSPGWWGSVFLLTANATFFGSLLFGFAFLWTIAPGWPPPVWLAPSQIELGVGTLGAFLGPFAMRHAIRTNANLGNPIISVKLALFGACLLAYSCSALLLRTPPPIEHAYGATLFVLGGYGIFHAVLAILMTSFLIMRIQRGFTSPMRRAEFSIIYLWVNYASVIVVLVLLAGHLPGIVA